MHFSQPKKRTVHTTSRFALNVDSGREIDELISGAAQAVYDYTTGVGSIMVIVTCRFPSCTSSPLIDQHQIALLADGVVTSEHYRLI